jgi:rare lipoprotein A
MKSFACAASLALVLSGCGSVATRDEAPAPQAPAQPSQTRPGAFYKDDGPGDNPPADLAQIPDAQPKLEPLRQAANRPYRVFGREYVPLTTLQPFRQRGVASWYGRRYHGQKTSSGEVYDMYAMTAAHPTLPIPSYVRVTSVANGRSVLVRVNDRGPFLAERVIDLSYAAAFRLGYVQAGSAEVELEIVLPEQTAGAAASAPDAKPLYLQIGAFSSRENAEDLRARLSRQLTWLTETVEVHPSGSLWRLHVGPYRSGDLARTTAERIEAELKLKPMLVSR